MCNVGSNRPAVAGVSIHPCLSYADISNINKPLLLVTPTVWLLG